MEPYQARPADLPAIVAPASIAFRAAPLFSVPFILTTLPPRIVAAERPFRHAPRRVHVRYRRGSMAAPACHGKTSVGGARRDS
ncbi:hypothetical protein C7S14_6747 [Burkholderia cepacia]|nr:hypothetical protein C7S14_6747 [Burkholderia cepacia]